MRKRGDLSTLVSGGLSGPARVDEANSDPGSWLGVHAVAISLATRTSKMADESGLREGELDNRQQFVHS